MRSEADAALVERAVHRDKVAFAALYDLYAHRVYAFCLRIASHHEDAEDLTALTFERALQAIAHYDNRGIPFSSWLLRIAAHTAAQKARRDRREHDILENNSAWPRGDSTGCGDGGLDILVERWEAAKALRAHIDTLSPNQATVVRMRYWDDLSMTDIANRTGRTEDATRKVLFRAIKTLRARVVTGEGLLDNDEAQTLGDARERRQRAIGAQTGRPRATHA